MSKLKYRARFVIHCDCGAKHGQGVQNFEAEDTEGAWEYVKGFMSQRNPPKGQNGVRYSLQDLRRIDVEEQSTKLDLNADHAESAKEEQVELPDLRKAGAVICSSCNTAHRLSGLRKVYAAGRDVYICKMSDRIIAVSVQDGRVIPVP
jgi:hypothetical protein